jgi:polyhydroxyalkanoate synthesis regulator phasin
MSEETRKVLEMVAEGRISTADAERILQKLNGSSQTSTTETETKTESSETASAKKPRFLRIVVDKPGSDQVNIRMPLAFTRTGTQLLAVLPSRVSEKLAELGIDPAALAKTEGNWEEALGTTDINIEQGDRKKVRIFCE